MRKDGKTDITKLIVAFHKFENASKNGHLLNEHSYVNEMKRNVTYASTYSLK